MEGPEDCKTEHIKLGSGHESSSDCVDAPSGTTSAADRPAAEIPSAPALWLSRAKAADIDGDARMAALRKYIADLEDALRHLCVGAACPRCGSSLDSYDMPDEVRPTIDYVLGDLTARSQ
jgi:hypothetical protein